LTSSIIVSSFSDKSFFHLVALAQVMTRAKLTWRAKPRSIQQVAGTFRNVLCLVLLFFVLRQVCSNLSIYLHSKSGMVQFEGLDSDTETDKGTPFGVIILDGMMQGLQLLFGIYILFITCRTRMRVREQYQIPERCCHGCEDFFCALCCSCCTTMQMMRHTADYDTQPASCCTATGLPSWVQTV
jgi:Cys-rich protein (TIGR01571 family)